MERHIRRDIQYRWILRHNAGEALALPTGPTSPLKTHGSVSGKVTVPTMMCPALSIAARYTGDGPSTLAVLASRVQRGQEHLRARVPGGNRAIVMKPQPIAEIDLFKLFYYGYKL